MRLKLFFCFLISGRLGEAFSKEFEAHQRPAFTAQGLDDHLNEQDWESIAQVELDFQLSLRRNTNQAKNVIVFIGDGMGTNDQSAARFLLAERDGESIDKVKLAWEKWGYSGMAKTYSVDFKAPDSAATATAIYCGVKAQDGTVGLNQHVSRGNCSAQAGNAVTSALHKFMQEDKWGGLVSTAKITHATPACTYAHAADRSWEADSDIREEDRATCEDIAHQLIHRDLNKDIRVILGGGRQNFLPNSTIDPEYPSQNGVRVDGKNLMNDWRQIKADSGLGSGKYQSVINKSQFDAVDPKTTDYIFGVFEPDHMQYEVDRNTGPSGEPSIAEMTEKAIRILSRSPSGYFLTVEGGRIDQAHHLNNGHKALVETMMLSDAVKVADELTSEEDTLIILTADHDHPFTFAGTFFLKNKILDILRTTGGSPIMLSDGKPYQGLGYARGPGFHYHKPDPTNQQRIDITNDDVQGKEYLHDCTLPGGTSHGASDVAIYSKGPMAHLFTGSHEQHYIPHAYLYAACVGQNKDHCNNMSNLAIPCGNTMISFLIILVGVCVTHQLF